MYCPIRGHRRVLQCPWSHPNQLLIDAFNVRIPRWFSSSLVARYSGLSIFSLKLLCCFQYLRDRLQMKQPFLTYADKGSGSLSNRNHVEVLRELSFPPTRVFFQLNILHSILHGDSDSWAGGKQLFRLWLTRA